MVMMSKLPSFRSVVTGAADGARRFPLPLLSALVFTVAAIVGIDLDEPEPEAIYQRLMLTSALGVPFLFALSVLAERISEKVTLALLAPWFGAVLMLVYFFLLPTDVEPTAQHLIRFAILIAGAHFLVAFLPYLRKDDAIDFWHYNKSLFLRFLLATLFTAVLYIGLTIALAAAEHLFGMNIPERRHFQLFILMAGLAHPWVFLAGVPYRGQSRVVVDALHPLFSPPIHRLEPSVREQEQVGPVRVVDGDDSEAGAGLLHRHQQGAEISVA